MFCQKCGRELGENEKFCGGCGTPVNAQAAETEIIAEPTPKPQEKKRCRKSIVPIIIGVILLAAIIAAVVLMRFDFGETDSVTAMLETAQKYLVELNYEQAIAEFNKVIEVDPINVDAYLGLAEAYERSGDTEKAIEVLERGYELTGNEEIVAELNNLIKSKELILTESVTTTMAIETTILVEEEGNVNYSESELKNKMLSLGNIVGWEYGDYDGDGEYEAFAVLGYENDYIKLSKIYFINSVGIVTEMSSDFWGIGGKAYYYSSKYTDCYGKGVFSVESGSGGSGWQTLIYSVKSGVPYELDISRQLQGFYENNGVYYTTKNVFLEGGGHIYEDVVISFDITEQQFYYVE